MNKVEKVALTRTMGRIQRLNETAKRAKICRTKCSLCEWLSNPRGTEESALRDLLFHAEYAHASEYRKHLRDAERAQQLGRL